MPRSISLSAKIGSFPLPKKPAIRINRINLIFLKIVLKKKSLYH
jgi:hypothetical protein